MTDFSFDELFAKNEDSSVSADKDREEGGSDFSFDELFGKTEDASQPESQPRSWVEGDGGAATLPEGEANEWGGNLRNEGRRVLLRRDDSGKVNGYSTTNSMLVQDQDGSYAVVPTVVDGQELSPEDAVAHYAKTGEYWGRAKDEKSAREMAQSVHNKHAELNQKGWNDYIHSHWDEMGEGITKDRGTAYEHKKRTGAETTLLERMANGDIDADLKRKDDEYNNDYDIGYDAMGLPIGRSKHEPRKDKAAAAMDDMAALAKEAGLEDWQVKRLRENSKTPEEMHEALRYVADNRQRALENAPAEQEPEKTGLLRSVGDLVVQIPNKLAAKGMNLIGTMFGGRSNAKAPVMLDDPMAKKEGESFDHWYKRVKFNPTEKQRGETGREFAERIQRDGDIRKYAKKYFDYEAPIAGKEGMRPASAAEERAYRLDPRNQTLNASSGRFGTEQMQKIGDFLVQTAGEYSRDVDRHFPVGNTGVAAVDWLENAALGIGQFAVAGPTMVPMVAAESYQQTRDVAVMSGKSPEAARNIALAKSGFDGLMTTAFYLKPMHRWLNGKKIVSPSPVKDFTFKEMKRAAGRTIAKQQAVNQAIAAGEASTIMGAQGMGDAAMEAIAQGRDVDLGEVIVRGAEGVRDGAIIGAIMGAANIANSYVAGGKAYEQHLRTMMEHPAGRELLAEVNRKGVTELKDFLNQHKEFVAGDASEARKLNKQFKDLCNKAGLPADEKMARDFVNSAEVQRVLRRPPPKSGRDRNAPGTTPEPPPDAPVSPDSPILPPVDPEAPVTSTEAEAATEAFTKRFGVAPKQFQLPTTPDGKPEVYPYITVDKRTGKKLNNVIALDRNTGICINDNFDGTFTVFNQQEGNPDATSDTANSLAEAVELAKVMAIKDQYTAAERAQKRQGLDILFEQKGVSYPVANTMRDALAAVKAAGIDLSSLKGLKDDAPFIALPNGQKILILDNLADPAAALNALNVGTPDDRGAFADGVKFETEASPDENGNLVETKVARDAAHGVTIADNGDGTFVVFDQKGNYNKASSLEEAVAVANGAKPKPQTPKQETANETGNGAHEAPAKPEEGTARQPEVGEAADAKAPEPPRGETPREGVVKEVAELAKKRQELQSQYDANLDEDSNPQDAETAHKLEKEIDAIDSRLGEIEVANPGSLTPELKAVARTPKSAAGVKKAVKSLRDLSAEELKNRKQDNLSKIEDLQKSKKGVRDGEVLAQITAKIDALRDENDRIDRLGTSIFEVPNGEGKITKTDGSIITDAEMRQLEDAIGIQGAVSREDDKTIRINERAWDTSHVDPKTGEKYVVPGKFDDAARVVKDIIDNLNKKLTSQPTEKGPATARGSTDQNLTEGGQKTTTAQPAENAPTTAPKPAEAQTPAEAAKPVETASRASDAKPAEKEAEEKAKPAVDTSDLEKMIAAADPDLESTKASGDAEAFKKALDAKGLPLEDSFKFLDRFYETHPRAAASARVKAKNLLKAKNRGRIDKPTTDFAQHLIDKYAPDGQTYAAKTAAIKAATEEKAKVVPQPEFIAQKKAGDARTRVNEIVDYLGDKGHNGPSLTKAINDVDAWYQKNKGQLALGPKADRERILTALKNARERRAKIKAQDQQKIGEVNAVLPKNQVERFVGDNPKSVLARWLEEGSLLARPRSAKAAKVAAGISNTFINEKYDGKMFDPDEEGADALNGFFDGRTGADRDMWLRILFGKDTKEVTEKNGALSSNDEIAERTGMSVDETLDALQKEFDAFQKWRRKGGETDEEQYYRWLAEEEQKALDDIYGPVDEEYRIEELEARRMADLQYANAVAYVENHATNKDIAVLKPSALKAAEEGDEIRIDHHKKTFEFADYDAKNGILYVNDLREVEVDGATGVVREPRRFRVTEEGISEIREEPNGRRDETGASDAGAADAQGKVAGGGGEVREGGGEAANAGKPAQARPAGEAAGAPKEASAYGTVAKAVDPAWQSAHPTEVQKFLDEGVPASAVAANPNVGGTDKISWPITATRVNTRKDAASLFRIISNPDIEISKALYLDADGNILGSRVVCAGYIGQTKAGIGEVLRDMPKGTFGVVFSHNHPAQQGAEVMPTPEDTLTTGDLRDALEAKGVKLLDHIITDHTAFHSYVGTNAVSKDASKFWDGLEMFGDAVEASADAMNLVPYDERVDMTKGTEAKLNALAAMVAKSRDNSTWVAGIDDDGKLAWVASMPKGGDIAAFLDSQHGAKRFAVLNNGGADIGAFVDAIERKWDGKNAQSRPLVIATGENGKLTDYDPTTGVGLNDKLRATGTPKAETPRPRLANAPVADKTGLDILNGLDEFLRAPVAALDKAQERKLRVVAEQLMDHLKAKGYDKFEDMMRFVAAYKPEAYAQLKEPFRRAWNFNVDDTADEITVARSNEIFGIIDTELQEAANDRAEHEQHRDRSGSPERDRTLGGDSAPGGAGFGDDGSQDVLVGGRTGLPADNGNERGRDVRNDGVDGGEAGAGGRPGVGGDAGGERTGVGPDTARDGNQQRNTEGTVHELNEVTPGFAAYEPPPDLPVKSPESENLIVESTALASVAPPKIETKPDIPDSIPETGILQAHQYQAVCQAVNAQNKTLPDGRRMGYFCGDGTGVGKTRVIAGVMLDAVNRKLGKGRALIVSKDTDLFKSALRDFEPFGIADKLFELDTTGRKRLNSGGSGVAFTTYASLAKEYGGTDADGRVDSRGGSPCRYAQLVKWLGKDFDGVIAFDEAHSAAKGNEAVEGDKQASWTQTVLDLQDALPNARILYLTATSAYNAKDLKFLQRMGLWGEGTGFSNQSDFASAVNDGGLSMMEMLTQSMKARGQYCSRSISFKGVTCRREIAALTPEQKAVYNQYADVIRQIHDAAISLASFTNDKPNQLAKQYFGRALDLFNSLMTAMKVQKAIEIGRQAIAEGKSPVFQLISTNEAAKKAKGDGKKPKAKDINLFSTPEEVAAADMPEAEVGVKDRILAYLNSNSFPVRLNTKTRDAKGRIVRGDVVPGAAAIRDEMIELVSALPDVGNPIDEIVKAFSDVGISRISSGSKKTAEADAFNSGKNLALVFSGAGGTGASYHADKRFKNQRQRVQIPIEFGWEPDKFLQALGRSHRNNQVVPPEFVLLTTDIAGEMRFMSTIANRVASMGAIVGGDRNSSGQVVSAADSLDSTYGRAAIRDVIHRLGSGQRIGEMSAPEVLDTMFLNPGRLDEVTPNQFLGRLQFLDPEEQSAIYSEIASHMEHAIAQAKADGTYDDGIRKIDAKRVLVQKRDSMSTGDNAGQTRDLLTVSEWYDSRRLNHEELEARANEGQRVEYVRNRRSGKLYALLNRPDGGYARIAPNGAYETILPMERANYEDVMKDAGRKAWDEEYASLPAEEERIRHYMSGDLIPVWDRLGLEGRPYVYRATPSNDRPFIGLHIDGAQLPVTLYGFGKKAEARKFFKENAYRLVYREGAKFGIGASNMPSLYQPYFKRAKIGTRPVLVVFNAEGNNDALVGDLMGSGWQGTWWRDESNIEDRGGQVYFRDFVEDAEAAFNSLVDKYGVVQYKGNKVVFSSKDGITVDEAVPEGVSTRSLPERRESASRPAARPGSIAERVGMPRMRMRVQNGELIITNTDSRHRNDLKLAFGGQWANRIRDGRRYVRSDLKWNADPTGRGGWWSIPLDKVPADIRAEIESAGLLNAPVAPFASVDELNRSGGVARLAKNPEEFKATFVYNLLRSPVAALDGNRYAPLSEGELIRRAADEGDMAAIGELYNRYMKPGAAKGGLMGLIKRAAARERMSGVVNEDKAEEIASLVWAGVKVEEQYKGDPNATHYEYSRNGIITDFNNGDTAIYKNAKSLIPVMTTKIERILKSMAERAANRPEMLTLDRPSASREGESELDQQIADEPSVAEGLLAADAPVDYEEPEGAIAQKLMDVRDGFGGRQLTPEKRNQIAAMDVLEETMFFLPESLQDVINAVLTQERMRGWIDPERETEKRIAKASFANAQKESGLSPRVFGYRYRQAVDLLNDIYENIRGGKADENILIKAAEVEGAQETEEELNDEILRRIEEREPMSDMALAVRLLLDGHATADVAEFFEIDPKIVRAWKARARNEQGITFPDDKAENTLGLGDFPERKAVKRGKRAQKPARIRQTAWTPDLFAVGNVAVSDVKNDKIEEGIDAGAPDEQIAADAGVDKVLVKLARIRRNEPMQGSLWDEGTLNAPVAPLEQGTLGMGEVEPPYGYTNAAVNEWRAAHGFNEIAKSAKVSLDELDRKGAAMASNMDEMAKMVERLTRSPYAINAVDQNALGHYIVRLQNAYNDTKRKAREAAANGNDALAVSLDVDAEDIISKLDAAHRVNARAGSEWGRAGRIRQIAIDKDGNLADYMISLVRAKGGSLTKDERQQAERLFAELEKANIKLDEAAMQDLVQHLDALSKARLARQRDEVRQRETKFSAEQVERDYYEALAQIRYHGEHRSGGVLHGLPNGQKWIRALETYHLLNGEGLTDGAPDAAKMVDLLVKDINGVGVEASAWDVRQMESRMGNLVKPSQDEISRSLRDLHSQMLIAQQTAHMLETGEMPPKTGFDRDEESAAVRSLRRERDRTMRELGIERKTAEELLKTALDAYKTRLRNQIEGNERAISDIESGKPYEKRGKRKLNLDEEAQSLKERNEELKRRIAELTHDPAKEHEEKVMRAMDALAKTIAVRKEQIAAIQAGTFDFDAKRPKLEDERLVPLKNELEELNRQKNALKKALFPFGTDAEIEKRMKQRVEAAQRSLDRWNAMAAEYEAETSWEGRAKAVAPSERRQVPESDELKEKRKLRDAARAKVQAYRKQLEREDTRGEATRQWLDFLRTIPRVVWTYLDMSVTGVQGGKFMVSHPIRGIKTTYAATKSFFRKKWTGDLVDKIKNNPYFEDFKAHGGHIYSMDGLDTNGLDGGMPEDFEAVGKAATLPGADKMKSVLSKIPGSKTLGKVASKLAPIERSRRSFAGFLNSAGLELYRSMVEAAGRDGTGATDNVKKDIAKFVNISLGWGYDNINDEKGLVRALAEVSDALAFAPRKTMAELKYFVPGYVQWENWRGSRRHEKSGSEIKLANKLTTREQVRFLLGSLAFGICGMLLAAVVNGDDDDKNILSDILDLRSPDFGRVRIGNTSFSFLAGGDMVWRFFARLALGQTKVNGIVSDISREDVVKQYVRGKANPLLSVVWDWATGKNAVGKDVTDKSAGGLAKDYLLPITTRGEVENFEMNDPLTAIVNMVPIFFGFGKSTYERDPLDRVAAQGDEAKRSIEAAGKVDDAEAAKNIGSRFKERAKVYGAAKGLKNMEQKLKNLEAQAKTLKYTIDRSPDGGSKQLQKHYADVTKGIENLKKAIEKQRTEAEKVYRESRGEMKWNDMRWTE